MVRKIYKTRRLILRPYQSADFKVWAWAYSNLLPKKSKHDWVRKPDQKDSLREFKKIVLRHKKLAKKDNTYVWPIFEKKTGALLGSMDIYIISRDVLQVGNLGYRIHNRYWRKGFAKEAVVAVILKAFKDLHLNRLEAMIDLDNKPSIFLAKAVGLKRECIRKKYYFQHGHWEDQVVFTANRKDFGFSELRPKI